MTSLYDIVKAINELELFDEDGNLDEIKLKELDIPLDEKIENIALFIKNEQSLADSIRAEEKALAERRKAHENRAKRLENYLLMTMQYLGYKKREFARVVISTRVSTAVEETPEFIEYAQKNGFDSLLTYAPPKPNKNAIKNAIKLGEVIDFVNLVERTSLTIK